MEAKVIDKFYMENKKIKPDNLSVAKIKKNNPIEDFFCLLRESKIILDPPQTVPVNRVPIVDSNLITKFFIRRLIL